MKAFIQSDEIPLAATYYDANWKFFIPNKNKTLLVRIWRRMGEPQNGIKYHLTTYFNSEPEIMFTVMQFRTYEEAEKYTISHLIQNGYKQLPQHMQVLI